MAGKYSAEKTRCAEGESGWRISIACFRLKMGSRKSSRASMGRKRRSGPKGSLAHEAEQKTRPPMLSMRI